MFDFLCLQIYTTSTFEDPDNPFKSIDHIAGTFNGLSELLQRKDVGTELLIKYKHMNVENIIQLYNTDQNKSLDMISQLKATELLLAHKSVQSKLTKNENIILKDAVAKNQETKKKRTGIFGASISTYDDAIKYNNRSNSDIIEPQSSYYVTTPYGTPVGVEINTEFDSGTIAYYDMQFKAAYPNATFISSSSAKYNCHSYAWYQQSRYNPYWMPNPSAYMTDGSYTKRAMSTVRVNDKFYYAPSVGHTGVVTTVNGTSYSQIILTSKWGSGPLMKHAANYGPYSTSVSSPTDWR